MRKGVFRNFAKFTGKHLCQSLFFNKVLLKLIKTLNKDFKSSQSLRHLPRYIVNDQLLFDKNQATLLSPHLVSLTMVKYSQETSILAECAALCIKYMKNVIIDSHHEIFYRAAGLEIYSHKNIRRGASYQI